MKYMGSKARIAKHILPIILKDRKPGQLYVEPFCGGCNLIDKVDGPRMAADINPYFIVMWKALQVGRMFPFDIPKSDYDMARTCFNNQRTLDPATIGWIGFMGSFNGRFFVGGYASTHGNRNYIREQIKNTLRQLSALRGMNFQTCSYEMLNLPENCLIYCNPRMLALSSTPTLRDSIIRVFGTGAVPCTRGAYGLCIRETGPARLRVRLGADVEKHYASHEDCRTCRETFHIILIPL